MTSSELLEAARLRPGDADVLVGGPPCQPFSKSAYWASGSTRRLNDPRASTLEHFLRVLRDAQPKTFLLENVPGLGYRNKSEGLDLLQKTIHEINQETGAHYDPHVAVLNAASYGVPQERRRLFVVGHREGLAFSFPDPTHRARGSSDASLRSPLTTWDAIGDLEEDDDPQLVATGKWADLLPSIPEGQNYLYHTPRGEGLDLFGWRTRYWSFLLKLAKNRPSWTLTAQPGPSTGPFHWKSRRLSAREMARLQTFPQNYKITGDLRSAQRQLGNAVPSALAERLALEIRRQFLGVEVTRGSSLLPRRRLGLPTAEPAGPVPEEYLARLGAHDPHPGTGLGPGARRRRERVQR